MVLRCMAPGTPRPIFALGGTFALNAVFWGLSLALAPGPWPPLRVAAE